MEKNYYGTKPVRSSAAWFVVQAHWNTNPLQKNEPGVKNINMGSSAWVEGWESGDGGTAVMAVACLYCISVTCGSSLLLKLCGLMI